MAGIDTSIYQNLKLPQVADPIEQAKSAMSLQTLGMQQMAARRQLAQQMALRQAYAQNTDANGNVNQQGVYKSLADLGMGYMVPGQQQSFAGVNKAQAEAQQAQYTAQQQHATKIAQTLDYLQTKVPEDQRATVYPKLRQQLIDQGSIQPNEVPEQYYPDLMGYLHYQSQQAGPYTQAKLTQANTAKAQAETEAMPVKIASDLYGRSSPNATISNQYEQQAKPIQSSQMAMQQMLKNYADKSPQGDASLVLNAFKIKFPNAPDVNSLSELSHAEGVSNQMKNWVSEKLAGVKDQNTRDDLMRDAFGTFEGNVEGLRGIQSKYLQKAKNQGVPGANDIIAEPAIENTLSQVQALKKQIGPYVPPTERPGIMGSLTGLASKLMGTGGVQTANASTQKYRPPGSTVTSDQVAQYATRHGKTLKDAQSILKGMGYVLGN